MKRFSAKIPLNLIEVVKANVDEEQHIATASNFKVSTLQDLQNISIPESVNLEKNRDIFVAVFNGAVINQINLNFHGTDTATILKAKDLFLHKPLNLEHEKDRIVGHIVSVGWSSYKENKMLSDEEVATMDEPFNLVIAAVIYGYANPQLADSIYQSATSGEVLEGQISSSWEVTFDDFYISVGEKNLKNCKLIKDYREMENYYQYVRFFGGKGVDEDGNIIGAVICGDILPIGFALTTDPAADVKGLVIKDIYSDDSCGEPNEKIKDSESQAKISNNKEEKVIMNIEDIIKLIPSEHAEASRNVFEQEIKKASEDYDGKIKAKETELSEAKSKTEEMNKIISENEETIASLKAELNKIKEDIASKQMQEDFNNRMNFLNENYSLDDEDCKIIANTISSFTEEQYESWLNTFKVLAKEKGKDFIAKKEQEIADKLKQEEIKKVEASVEPKTEEEILESAKVEDSNNISIDEKGSKRFSLKREDVVINYRA